MKRSWSTLLENKHPAFQSEIVNLDDDEKKYKKQSSSSSSSSSHSNTTIASSPAPAIITDDSLYKTMFHPIHIRRYFSTAYPCDLIFRLLAQDVGPRRMSLSTTARDQVRFKWLHANETPQTPEQLRSLFTTGEFGSLFGTTSNVDERFVIPRHSHNLFKNHPDYDPQQAIAYLGVVRPKRLRPRGEQRPFESSTPLVDAVTLHLNHRVANLRHAHLSRLARECSIDDALDEVDYDTLFVETERELVFDLDIRDWEDQRPGSRRMLCHCNEKSACRQCWLLVEMSLVVFDHLFCRQLKLGEMMVVFSGGKGAHIWYGSPRARQLSTKSRKAIAEYYFPKNEQTLMDTLVANEHGCYNSLINDLYVMWIRRGVQTRELLADSNGPLCRYLTTLCPTVAWLRPNESCPDIDNNSPRERSMYNWIVFTLNASHKVVLRFLWMLAWPVIDGNVLVSSNHTVKAPFSLHASTLRVALPLNGQQIQQCDPQCMPTPLTLTSEQLNTSRRVLQLWLDRCEYK